MTFVNSVVGGVTLVRPAIQSPDFVSGSAGWRISIDGSAEFNDIVIRGGSVLGGDQLLYDGTPALDSLYMSLSQSGGVDPFGNSFVPGLGLYDTNSDLVAWFTPNDGDGRAGLFTYDTRFGVDYVSALTGGDLTLGTTTVDRPGFLSYSDLGGGLYAIEIESGGDANTAGSQINIYSETSPAAGDAFISIVTDELLIAAAAEVADLVVDLDCHVDGVFTASNFQAGTAATPAPGTGGGTTTVNVTFSPPMPSTPTITLAPRTSANPHPTTGERIEAYVDGVSATGFTIRAYRSGNSATTWMWQAYAD